MAVWGVRGSDPPKAALSRLPLASGAPLQLSSCPAHGCSQQPGDFLLVAVSTLGEAHVWLCSAEGLARGAAHRVRVGPSPAPGRPQAALDGCILAAAALSEDGSGAPPLPPARPSPRTVLFSVAGPS